MTLSPVDDHCRNLVEGLFQAVANSAFGGGPGSDDADVMRFSIPVMKHINEFGCAAQKTSLHQERSISAQPPCRVMNAGLHVILPTLLPEARKIII